MRGLALVLALFAGGACGDPATAPGPVGDGAGGGVGDGGQPLADGGEWPELTCPVSHSYSFEPFSDKEVDSGWLPADSNIQVRLVVKLASRVAVTVAGSAILRLGPGPTLTYRGTPGAGSAEMDLGVQVSGRLRVKLDLPVVGTIDWEGDLPLNPAFDFRFVDSKPFTPYLLQGAGERPVELSDTVAEKKLFTVPVPGLGIPFVAGGSVVILGRGRIDAAVTGERMETTLADGTTLVQTNEDRPVAWVGSPDQAATATYTGKIQFTGGIVLLPGVGITVVGKTFTVARFPIELDLGAIDLPDHEMSFTPQPLSFELPAPGAPRGF